MDKVRQSLRANLKIMKSQVTRYAVYGTLIAAAALILATLINAYLQSGKITIDTIILAQKSNVTLWFLDGMPFIFAFWGQHTSAVLTCEAGNLVEDQTADLRHLTETLEHKVAHDATHDSLTGLPNRILLYDRLDHAVQSAYRRKEGLVLMILDIDEFKNINETLGHFSGDQLLCQVVSRLRAMLRKSDTLARIGADEFAILLNMNIHTRMVINIVKKIQKTFLEPFSIEGLTLEVMASIGIAFSPDHGKEADTIIQRAGLALFEAKQNTRKFVIYSGQLDKTSPKRLTMMGELRRAIDNDELIVHYQPQIDLKQKGVASVEALVRWQHPDHGFMPPNEFIPLAERTGLIRPLTTWVLDQVLEQLETWHRAGLNLGASVNLSPAALLDTQLPNTIVGMLSRYEIPSGRITLEVTEGSMINDPDLAMKILSRLAGIGLKISIDDFGTGYSSMAYLKKLPAKELKIDKSFVMDMMKNENDAVIVKSIIDLGHNLSMEVVAEGVETLESAVKLRQLGCDILQGFYFSRPLGPEEFIQWLQQQKIGKKSLTRAKTHAA